MSKPKKLTATQKAILLRAQNSPIKAVSVEFAYGRGPKGGKISYGLREFKAATELWDLGYLERTHQHKATLPDGGYTVWVVSRTYSWSGYLIQSITA